MIHAPSNSFDTVITVLGMMGPRLCFFPWTSEIPCHILVWNDVVGRGHIVTMHIFHKSLMETFHHCWQELKPIATDILHTRWSRTQWENFITPVTVAMQCEVMLIRASCDRWLMHACCLPICKSWLHSCTLSSAEDPQADLLTIGCLPVLIQRFLH